MRIKLIFPRPGNEGKNQSELRFLSRLLGPFAGEKQGRSIMGVMPLALPTIAALTPPDHEVIITDENVEPIDYEEAVDIVGITFVGISAHRAYEIATKFREKGVHVVLGGIHASMLPDEAQPYADTLFIGEAEDTWPEFIEDFKNKTPQRTYRTRKRPDLQKRVIPRWDLIRNRYYYTYFVQTTRGCPFDCDYCCSRQYLGAPRSKPIENVLAEIQAVRKYAKPGGADRIVFADDNIFSNREYSKELFKALIPLRIQWSSQCSLNIAKDDEVLDLARESGCQSLIIGFESLSQESLESINKGTVNKAQEFEKIIAKIHSRKINVGCAIMFGFDGEDETVFERTSTFLKKTSVAYPIFNILTPAPGTRLYARLEKEGRLLHQRWAECNGTTVCYKPKNMTEERLRQGFYWILRDQYSVERVLARVEALWELGIIKQERTPAWQRLGVTILLALQLRKEKGDMARLLKEVIRMIWTKKGINIEVPLVNLAYFDFARNLPGPNVDFGSMKWDRAEALGKPWNPHQEVRLRTSSGMDVS